MAALTENTNDARKAIRHLEDVTITNGSGAGAKTRFIRVPEWANRVTFYLFNDVMTGTTPLLDFVVGVPDFGGATKFAAPTDDTDALLGDQSWNGITQVTAAGPSLITVNIGPDLTADDTGSATASCNYDVRATLPPVLYYTITTDATTGDEDYAHRLVAHFKA
jgi:hypothetical protein